MSGPFLSTPNISAIDTQGTLVSKASVIGLRMGEFPGVIETDLGNGCPLHLNHAVSDKNGTFTGVAYLQCGGLEVLVYLD